MTVGNRHAEGVGGIVGLGDGLEVQHYAPRASATPMTVVWLCW